MSRNDDTTNGMRVLIVNASERDGGAGRAAHRLHRALLAAGANSRMLVQTKTTDDQSVLGPPSRLVKTSNRFRKVLDTWPVRRYKDRMDAYFSPAWLPLSTVAQRINDMQPDIVHLHWIGEGMMRIEDLAKIDAPVVWSLHDNWAFTGGCHVRRECMRYLERCGKCPQLGSNADNDLSRSVFRRKQNTYRKMPGMHMVGLSDWMAAGAKTSLLLKHNKVVCLPNPIDTDIYAPFPKDHARKLLNLPPNKKLIAFGAIRATSDENKGFVPLIEAMRDVDEHAELVVFGSTRSENADTFRQKAHFMGLLTDDVSLRLLYCAADLVVVPSLEENLSNVIMESLACGTPVVAFDVGGNRDMIEHRQNGYLAEPYHCKDLGAGMNWVLHTTDYLALSLHSREKAVRNYDSKMIARKYLDLYDEVISNHGERF